MSEEGIAAGAPAPAHETPEQVIGELFSVAKLKEDGFRAEITPSDIRSWAERFKEALFRDRDAARTESTDNEKFLACTVLSLVRAHYDRDEARFHEVSEGLAKFFDQTGRGDLASFVRAQTGDEPSWVPMDAAPTSSAPTAEPPTLGSLLAEARRLLERAQNTTRDTGVIADISESLECLSGAEDYAKATEGQPASESPASPAPSGEDSEKPAPDRTLPWPRCEREADKVEKRAGFARFCSTCGTACRYAGEEHLVICKHHQFAVK